MRIDWPDERCIICLGTPVRGEEETKRTNAHVIPESLGGKLCSPLLCKRCNDLAGTRLEEPLSRDVVIQGLVDALAEVLPADLTNRIRRNLGYFVDTEEFGRFHARLDAKGELRLMRSPSLLPDPETRGRIEGALRRAQRSDAETQARLAEFSRAEPGTVLEIAGLRIVKRAVPDDLDWRRTYDPEEEPVARAATLPIAYLYLALCIGGHVYGRALDPARAALRAAVEGDLSLAEAWATQPMQTRAPAAVHLLGVTQEADGVVVTICLFGDYVWPVCFSGVELRGVAPLYRLDLVSGEEFYA